MKEKELKAGSPQKVLLFGRIKLPQSIVQKLADHDLVAKNTVVNFLQKHSTVKSIPDETVSKKK